MKNIGTLEYVLDKYSGTWTWKITGDRAVFMVSKIITKVWYGDGPNEVIVTDDENLYNFNQGQKTTVKFNNNKVNKLFRDFDYQKI